jgi:hypothetical protein
MLYRSLKLEAEFLGMVQQLAPLYMTRLEAPLGTSLTSFLIPPQIMTILPTITGYGVVGKYSKR